MPDNELRRMYHSYSENRIYSQKDADTDKEREVR